MNWTEIRRIFYSTYEELYGDGYEYAKNLDLTTDLSPDNILDLCSSHRDPFDVGMRDYIHMAHGVGIKRRPLKPKGRALRTVSFYLALTALVLATISLVSHAQAKEVEIQSILYNPGDGWHVLNNETHESEGVELAWNDSSAILVDYDFHATKVKTFVVSTDEIYGGRMGVICGANVGLDYAIIECSRNGERIDMNTLNNRWGNIFIHGIYEDGY